MTEPRKLTTGQWRLLRFAYIYADSGQAERADRLIREAFNIESRISPLPSAGTEDAQIIGHLAGKIYEAAYRHPANALARVSKGNTAACCWLASLNW